MAGNSARRLRLWAWLHTWSSLVCTTFLLLCCVTGLPLIFAEEIDGWLDDAGPVAAVVAPGTPKADLDRVLATARGLYPGQFIDFVVRDDEAPFIDIGLRPTPVSPADSTHRVRFDVHTGKVLREFHAAAAGNISFIGAVTQLHTTLFAGLPGNLFLGAMALLFIVALISGVALYRPFTKKLAFGAIRTMQSRRVRWLDLHNLLGIATLAWMLVVGATGAINELSTPLFALWSSANVKAMTAGRIRTDATAPDYASSLQQAVDKVQAALPGVTVGTVLMPGGHLTPPGHYLLWAKGDTPLTAHLLQPVLVNAHSGRIDAIAEMPWYLRVLEMSRPLHFGDYGGLPLKLLWLALDLIAIMVLVSGLVLWLTRHRQQRRLSVRQP